MNTLSLLADTDALYCIDDRQLTIPEPFRLGCGESLKSVRVAMRMCGRPSAPVVIVLGGISANRVPVISTLTEGQGWWQAVLGHQGVDILSHYQVLSIDWLGGSGDTSGPPQWQVQGMESPSIDTSDQAVLLAEVLDQLQVKRVEAILGASYGGMVAMHFARLYPSRLRRLLVLGCAHRPEPMAVARRYVQKQILKLAENGADKDAVAVARALAITTYRSAAEFRSRFSGPQGRQALESYLEHQSRKFAKRFDRESTLTLVDSIDKHWISPADIKTPLWLLGIDTDELCPPPLIREFAAMVSSTCKLAEIHSLYGHDAFLCEVEQISALIIQFLEGAEA
ncbi:MAG: alpha/beta fold hydrolase [Gammaproteobacteria bacterium]|nr:alpha/beta fold hydrolase [Gammaproteobacteria bacterium]